jgi:hypothetical protein
MVAYKKLMFASAGGSSAWFSHLTSTSGVQYSAAYVQGAVNSNGYFLQSIRNASNVRTVYLVWNPDGSLNTSKSHDTNNSNTGSSYGSPYTYGNMANFGLVRSIQPSYNYQQMYLVNDELNATFNVGTTNTWYNNSTSSGWRISQPTNPIGINNGDLCCILMYRDGTVPWANGVIFKKAASEQSSIPVNGVYNGGNTHWHIGGKYNFTSSDTIWVSGHGGYGGYWYIAREASSSHNSKYYSISSSSARELQYYHNKIATDSSGNAYLGCMGTTTNNAPAYIKFSPSSTYNISVSHAKEYVFQEIVNVGNIGTHYDNNDGYIYHSGMVMLNSSYTPLSSNRYGVCIYATDTSGNYQGGYIVGCTSAHLYSQGTTGSTNADNVWLGGYGTVVSGVGNDRQFACSAPKDWSASGQNGNIFIQPLSNPTVNSLSGISISDLGTQTAQRYQSSTSYTLDNSAVSLGTTTLNL